MSGHTKGPWVSDGQRPTVFAADGFSVCDVEDWGLHSAFDGKTHPATTPGATIDRPREEALANARLIAAAPDLLEAAKEALAYCEHIKGSMFGVEPSHAATLRAAITRADGGGA